MVKCVNALRASPRKSVLFKTLSVKNVVVPKIARRARKKLLLYLKSPEGRAKKVVVPKIDLKKNRFFFL